MTDSIRVLLTGASGTVGSEILKLLHLEKNRIDITVFDLETTKTKRKLNPYKNNITIVYGDITNKQDVNKVSHDIDIVIHLAAIIPPVADEKPILAYEVNTLGTDKLISQLEENSPNAFFLFSSSISIYGDRLKTPLISVGDPLIPSIGDEYAKTKILAEKAIQRSKLDWSIFRLGAVMGGHKMTNLMFHQPLETSFEIVTPIDTARAFVNAIDHKEELSKRIFNLGGGEKCRTIYKDFLDKSFEVVGLGNADFPENTFAEKNFHCGFYVDGDDLNEILDFQNDSLDSYFKMEKSKVGPIRRLLLSLFRNQIKKHLTKQSEPLQAINSNDGEMISQYFDRRTNRLVE